MKKTDEEKRLLRFLGLYNKHYRHLFLFAKTLLPSGDAAEDVLQEVSLAMWRKFDSFEEGGNFCAWAFRMIRLEVLYWQRKENRRRRFFSEEFLEDFSEQLQRADADRLDERYAMLMDCSRELVPKMKDLLFKRYFEGWDVEKIATTLQLSAEAVYQQLSRLRTRLKHCVDEKIRRQLEDGRLDETRRTES